MTATIKFCRSITLFIFLGLTILSCSESTNVAPFSCDEDALFSRENATGVMFYLSCYDSWSIKMDETNADSSHLFAASLDIPEEFKQEGLAVIFDACFYEFDLPLLFPDPTFFGELYVIKDFDISGE